jgi:UV DNA damage endonuclease
MIRFGLCCIFMEEPIKFRTITAKTLYTLPPKQRLTHVSQICLHNAESLRDALDAVHRLGIGAFRILSPFFPRYTHPEMGYTLDELPDAKGILAALKRINTFRRSHDIRLSFHPDQFVVLNSPQEDVVRRSIMEIEYQAILAKALGAEVVNIHVGGAYGNKQESLKRFARNFERLSGQARKRLTLENDDSLFTPTDILPLCRDLRIPLVYDVHHHRCNPDHFSVEDAIDRVMETWAPRKQEPHFHISSPKYGWNARNPKPHADYIDISDIPNAWRKIGSITLDVEAKAKEKAVLKLKAEWPFP